MYNAAQFRQSLNLSQELISTWATAQTLGHIMLQDACPHHALDLTDRLAPFAETMLSQVLATRGYFLHHQDFWDVIHPDLPFHEKTDNPRGEFVLYDNQAAQAASSYQPYPEHRPPHGEHAQEHDSDEPQYIGTRLRCSFQARAFTGYSRSRSVPADRARPGTQSLSHEDEQTPP